MPRRRPMRTPSPQSVTTRHPRGPQSCVEPLEQRMMLTTITGSGTFEYVDEEDNIVRVAYSNITAEFIFANSRPDRVVLGDLVPPDPAGEEVDGKDLFAIWVVQATMNSYISVAIVPALDPEDPNASRPMQPFDGAPTLNWPDPETPGELASIGLTNGGIILGGRTPVESEDDDNAALPILRGRFFSGLGLIGPTDDGWLTAGLYVEPGQDLGRFLYGGTVLGEVTVGGSMDLFYAGNVLTGTHNQGEGPPANPDNFTVEGDLRNLIVLGHIGTGGLATGAESLAADYVTGFDMNVGGTLGAVRVFGSFNGTAHAHNLDTAPGTRGSLIEYEVRHDPDVDRGSDTDFEDGLLGDNNITFNNDSFDTPQYLGVFDHRKFGENAIFLHGTLQNNSDAENDFADYYAVPLMAGQTITVRLTTPSLESIHVGVFDPDGRLIATDYSNSRVSFAGQQFQVTADRPGVYRFAVAADGATDFASTGESEGTFDYQLQVLGVGELSFAALAADSTILGAEDDWLAIADNGDLGVVASLDAAVVSDFGGDDGQTILVTRGNLRAVSGDTIGIVNAAGFPAGDIGLTINGSVGLLRATGQLLAVHTGVLLPIAGDFQWIDVQEGALVGNIAANGSIGTVRAQTVHWADFGVSSFHINSDLDRNTSDTIDLLDVSGDWGSLDTGGAPIINNGGNVRYMRVGGQVYRDEFFGGNAENPTDFELGEETSFRDDSGVLVRLTPIPLNREVDLSTGEVVLIDPGQLSLHTYGVRGSINRPAAGGVILNVTSTRGLLVETRSISSRGVAEISTINANGDGTPIVENPISGELDLGEGDDLSVLIDGNGMLDVFSITGGNFVEISNATGGEIVNVVADSIGLLSARTVGMAKSRTRASIVSLDLADAPVLLNTPVAVQVAGDIVEIRTTQGVGNVLAARIESIRANSDRRFESGVFEGINGNIVADELRLVNIGEGVLYTGSGDVFYAGLFANGFIGRVENQGLGSDIRGDIVAIGGGVIATTGTPGFGAIREISLTDGSIIDADILVVTSFDQAREYTDTFTQSGVAGDLPETFELRAFEIDSISLSGRGGILGASILAQDVASITVNRGFGVLNSNVTSIAGTIDSIATDGYGLRFSTISGANRVGSLNARGRGEILSTIDFSPTARWSEQMRFDPFSGRRVGAGSDLHAFLGTSAANPIRTDKRGVSGAGSIADTVVLLGRQLDSVLGHNIKSSVFNVVNLIKSFEARENSNGVVINAGQLDRAKIGVDLENAAWVVTGAIGTIGIGRDFASSSAITATGFDGRIHQVATGREFNGVVTSIGDVDSISVGTHMRVSGITGDPFLQNIEIGGHLKSLIVQGHIYAPTTILVSGDIFSFILGKDLKENATIEANDIRSQIVNGQIFGDVILG